MGMRVYSIESTTRKFTSGSRGSHCGVLAARIRLRSSNVQSVVVAGLQDDHVGVVDKVDEPIRFVDAP